MPSPDSNLIHALAINAATLTFFAKTYRIDEATPITVAGYGTMTLRDILDAADVALGLAKDAA